MIVPAALHDEVAADLGPVATEAEEALSSGVNLLGLEAIKGLEFDAAVVLEPAADPRRAPGRRRRRALHRAHPLDPRARRRARRAASGRARGREDLRPVPEAGAAEAWAAGRRHG